MSSRTIRHLGLVATLGLAGLVAFAFPAPASHGSITVSDRILVSTPGHGMGEFAVARNPGDPNHLVIAGMDWNDPAGSVGCAAFVSRDGGRSWHRGGTVPGLDEPLARFDPWVAIDPQGRAHITCMEFDAEFASYWVGSFGPVNTGRPTALLMHARSDDGGDTWGAAHRIPARHENNQVDKDALFAASSGTLFACVNDYPRPADDLVVYRSFDGGAAWTPGVSLDPLLGIDGPDGNGFGNCNGFAEGPHGEVYLAWAGLFATEPFYRSGTVATFDDGASWVNPAAAARPALPPFPVGFALSIALYPSPSGISLAVSPTTGHLFVALWDYDAAADRFLARLWRSDDQGATYQEVPLPAVPTTDCQGCHAMRPHVATDAAGRLAVQLVLTSYNGGLVKETWFLISEDEGATWLPPIQLSHTDADRSYLDPRNFLVDPATAQAEAAWAAGHPGKATTVYGWEALARGQRTDHLRWGGDYWGITASNEGFVALWEDHWENGKNQLWARLVRVT